MIACSRGYLLKGSSRIKKFFESFIVSFGVAIFLFFNIRLRHELSEVICGIKGDENDVNYRILIFSCGVGKWQECSSDLRKKLK
jgi:hypothetical protein